MLIESVAVYCEELTQEFDRIPMERKRLLEQFSSYIKQKLVAKELPEIIVICTHNSRRSHFGQLWLAIAATYYQLPLQTFSGGTEATAFNIRAVNAMKGAGVGVSSEAPNVANPVYQISWARGMQPYRAFSKAYQDAPNPKEGFAALMVCSQADEACPLVAGSEFRLAVPYEDPKAFDNTASETKAYNDRCRQMAREMFFIVYKATS